jgi:hypothetical protein
VCHVDTIEFGGQLWHIAEDRELICYYGHLCVCVCVCVIQSNSVLLLIGIVQLLEAKGYTEILRSVYEQNLCYCIILLYCC